MTRMHGMVWLSVALTVAGAGAARAADAPVTASFGPWTATLGPHGLRLTHGEEVISLGSYLHMFGPGHEGTVLGSRPAWPEGRAEVSGDGRTVSLTADLSGGTYHYEATLEEDRVRLPLRVSLDESTARDQGWFMVARCYVLVEGE